MKINIESILRAPALMSVKDARILVGVSETKIYKDIQEGKLETTDEKPRMVRRDDLLKYVGISKEDILGFRNPQVMFPVNLPLDNVYLVLDEAGEFSELWVGSPGEGRLFELIEVK